MKKQTAELCIEQLKVTKLIIELIGVTDLILHKKSRSFEREQVFKQSHDKGTKIPQDYMESKNPWEKFITSITWEKPITFHDEDCDLYCEEEWKEYMAINRPCILTQAFQKSFAEAFKTFGFKDSTGKAGTDFSRALNIVGSKSPVTFGSVEAKSILVPNGGISNTNVVCHQNVFSDWKCAIEIDVPNVVFPYETILSVVDTAGKYIGIGSQRKNGNGRYHIGNVEVIKS